MLSELHLDALSDNTHLGEVVQATKERHKLTDKAARSVATLVNLVACNGSTIGVMQGMMAKGDTACDLVAVMRMLMAHNMMMLFVLRENMGLELAELATISKALSADIEASTVKKPINLVYVL